ncbi:MAG: hypothetical protein EON54_02670 [Alcaligenaceae bacterium]|jgi:hypothetical protein|uniref:hypothetical protein n=1 Tax=Curvibacter soli TaxID=3031331 RepID=UPI0010E1084C|nr:hypothetical protein [Ramlibacter sp. H39-3-26]MDF1484173.1 hypothetical protein [Ramlibacter sp. H39-3-26]RYH69204.1 MAG: hypothetical protein EON54_02670 [Alcaligenaceae bacterium]
MTRAPARRPPTLAQRAVELRALRFPGARVQLVQGHELRFWFSISPTLLSREYSCMLIVPRSGFPAMFVLSPDLHLLADGKPLPHIYRSNVQGTKLCLWLPRKNEWTPHMRLLETYIAWTGQWLNYFEEWLSTGNWAGGGEHPREKQKRWH